MSRGLFVPLDVNYRDDPKVIEAGPDAELVYLRSLVLAKRLGGNGFVHCAHLRGLCDGIEDYDGAPISDVLAVELVKAGLWLETDGGWLIAAWLKHNLSDEEIDAVRTSERDRKRQWRQSQKDDESRDGESHGTARDATDSRERGTVTTAFAEWWTGWPVKKDKKPALRAFTARIRAGASVDDLTRSRDQYLAECDRESRMVKYAATFLNGADGPWSEYLEPVEVPSLEWDNPAPKEPCSVCGDSWIVEGPNGPVQCECVVGARR